MIALACPANSVPVEVRQTEAPRISVSTATRVFGGQGSPELD
jgi:hypothetical protein